MDKATILAVDDELGVRLSIEESLKDEYNVITVENGEKALKSVVDDKPDLIILDLKLPGMDGIEILKKIKEIDNEIPVVVLTVIDNIETAKKIIKLGAVDYFNKPFDVSEIKILVKNILNKYKRPQNLIETESLIAKVAEDTLKENLTLQEAVKKFEKTYINTIMDKVYGNRKKALEILQTEENYLKNIDKNN